MLCPRVCRPKLLRALRRRLIRRKESGTMPPPTSQSKSAPPVGYDEVPAPVAAPSGPPAGYEETTAPLGKSQQLTAAKPGAVARTATGFGEAIGDRKSTRLNSSHSQISYAVFCLKKKKK